MESLGLLSAMSISQFVISESKAMKTRLNMDKIAKRLRARRHGRATAFGGYFGKMQLLSEVEARFRVHRAAAYSAHATNVETSRRNSGQDL
jgi:hypothetical protein